MDLGATVNTLKAAADPTRLRLLALLAGGEATVSELQEVLEQSQPRVSRHLRILVEGALAERFRDGHSVYYRVPDEAAARSLVSALLSQISAKDPTFTADSSKMVEVRNARARAAWADKELLLAAGRAGIPGLSADNDLARAFAEVPGDFGDFLDIGSGTGATLCFLAPRARAATGIDISASMRVVARTRVRAAGLSHCTVRRGNMLDLPFADASFDTVLLDQVLSLTDQPRAALREAARVLRPGGDLVVVTLAAHLHAEVSNAFGHTNDGFSIENLGDLLEHTGLEVSFCDFTSRERRVPYFEIITAFARKPAQQASRAS